MVGEFLGAIVSWPPFLAALLVFGFAPGAALRLIVLAFHRDDPRRSEMLAELHGVPRWERPFWVVEQLEVALSEGIWERVTWAATGRIIHRWRLVSGVKQNREHPESFWIPDEEAKQAIEPGVLVKLFFDMRNGLDGDRWAERMWVEVIAVKQHHIIGMLKNEPIGIPRLDLGDMVKFKRDHIIDICCQADVLSEAATEDSEHAQILPMCRKCNGHGVHGATDPEQHPPTPANFTGD
jgi:hypothetical protein